MCVRCVPFNIRICRYRHQFRMRACPPGQRFVAFEIYYERNNRTLLYLMGFGHVLCMKMARCSINLILVFVLRFRLRASAAPLIWL